MDQRTFELMNALRPIRVSIGLLLRTSTAAVPGAIEIPGISGTTVAGIDGAFEVPTSTLDPGTVTTGAWDGAPHSGFREVNDPEKWRGLEILLRQHSHQLGSDVPQPSLPDSGRPAGPRSVRPRGSPDSRG